MKTIKGIAAAVAGLAMTVTPVAATAATANPAASLSLAKARVGAATSGTNKLGAEVPTTTLISIGILAALVVGVLVATGGNDDDADSN
ncbi:MAG TPA: hypothetical protein VM900_00120 [Sphingomonas sp.]|nr:hypothetical protein [Sphingomonas sp.]